MTNDTQYRAHGTIIGNNINKDFYKFGVVLNTAASITIASRHETRLVEYMKLRENFTWIAKRLIVTKSCKTG